MQEEENVFFVKVKDPIELRRTLLEGAKEVIESLQKFERFKEIRRQKLESINTLKADLRELDKLIFKLRSTVPKAKLRVKLHEHEEELKAEASAKEEKKKKRAVKRKETKRHVVEKHEEEKPRTEIEKLENELNSIEETINTLA